MRLTVVYNPKSGDRRWTRSRIESRLKAAGHRLRMVSSKDDWEAALDGETDAYVAAGGDGTVHKLARSLAGSEIPLGIVPLGTANNIARAFGHEPGADPFARAPQWGRAVRRLRVGCASAGGPALPFLEVMGGGAFARLLLDDPGKKKKKKGPMASLMAARRRLVDHVLEDAPIGGRVDLDGTWYDEPWLLLACLRLPSFGPSLRLAPDQSPDAPGVTVVGVREDQRERFAWWLATGEGDPADYLVGRGEQLSVTLTGPVHVDDRLLDGTGDEPRTLSVDLGKKTVPILV